MFRRLDPRIDGAHAVGWRSAGVRRLKDHTSYITLDIELRMDGVLCCVAFHNPALTLCFSDMTL